MQPGNVIHTMSFLLYAVLSSAMETRLLLLYKDGVEEPAVELSAVGNHLADSEQELQRWLLWGRSDLVPTQYAYSYDYRAVGQTLRTLDPQAPLLLDLPFADSLDILSAPAPFERVFNLNSAYGAPGEVCIAYSNTDYVLL